jgi:CheY-like chemotaxis protein
VRGGNAGELQLRTHLAHPARVENYWLGGKANFAADRELATAIGGLVPDIAEAARAQFAFLRRAARVVAGEGVRQFVHIAVGLPTERSTHEVVQEVASQTRVVYVEDEPIALAHARALLAGDGPTTVVHADLRNADAILGHPDLRAVLDLARPVAVLVRVLTFVPDDEAAYGYLARLRDALAPGSYVVMPHITADANPSVAAESTELWRNLAPEFMPVMRDRAQVERFFTEFELLAPGVVPVQQWRPDDPPAPADRFWAYGGVARKP